MIHSVQLSAESTIDLGDLIGGGDGSGDGVSGSGINPINGAVVSPVVWGGDHHNVGRTFVELNDVVHALFIPQGSTKISSTGLFFNFPDHGNADSWDALRDGVSTLETTGQVRPIFLPDGSVTKTGVGIHANMGVTFDLDVIRDGHNSSCPSMRFSAIAGGQLGSMNPVGWVLLDGNQMFSQVLGQGTALDIPIEGARFLTLASTDGDGAYTNDKAYFANAIISIEDPPPSSNGNFALKFDGAQRGVQLPNAMAEAGNAFTWEGWVQPQTGPFAGFLIFHRAQDHDKVLRIGAQGPGTMQISLTIRDSINQAPEERTVAITAPFESCAWLHIAGSYDGSFLRLFVNGREEAKVEAPEFNGNLNWTDQWLGTYMGSNLLGQGPPYFRGAIDEVRVWSEARTEDQIAAGMTIALLGPQPGLLGSWSFDQNSGQTVRDFSGHNNDGQLGSKPEADSFDPSWVTSTLSISYIGISGISPQPCPTQGAVVTITGNGFVSSEGPTTITLGGVPVTPDSMESGQITFRAPGHVDAEVPIEILNPAGQVSAQMTYRSEFIRGDVTGDGRENIDITDGINILAYLFLGGSPGDCLEALDVNDNGETEITDGINLFTYLFLGGNRPPEPFLNKGIDPTPDSLFCGR